MSKHTPGPWKIRPLRFKYYGTEIDIGLSVVSVWIGLEDGQCTLSPREIADGATLDDVEWSHAETERGYYTSCLIAAAPDLYEALALLLEDLKDYSAWDRPCRAVDVAEAALKKARGEA